MLCGHWGVLGSPSLSGAEEGGSLKCCPWMHSLCHREENEKSFGFPLLSHRQSGLLVWNCCLANSWDFRGGRLWGVVVGVFFFWKHKIGSWRSTSSVASSVKIPLRAIKHLLEALSLTAFRGYWGGCTGKIPGYPLDHSGYGFADGSFSRGTFEINNWVIGLLKKGAVCPVSLLSWCAFVPRECMVMVWCAPHPYNVI